VSCFPPSRGRLSEYAYYLLNELSEFEEIAKVHVLSDKGGVSNSGIAKNGKIVVRRAWSFDDPFSLMVLLLKILKLRPDIVHFNVHMAVFGKSRLANFVGLSLPFFCRLLRLKSIVTLHNVVDQIDIDRCGFKSSTLNRMGAFLAIKFLSLASLITVTVKSYVDLMKKRYNCKYVEWVPHGTWKVPNNLENNNCNKEKRILFIGYVGPYKNLDLLFEACKILNGNGQKIRLLVAGSSHPNFPGVLEEYKQRFNDQPIDFLGFIPDEELSPLFKEVSTVVLPYATCTGTSGIAHLASSYGVPIVATNLPEFRELRKEGCGMLLCGHNPKDLAMKIETMLENEELANKLRKKSYDFASKRTWDKIAKHFLKLYFHLYTARADVQD